METPSITSSSSYSLLTDPFLQFPTETSVKVVWFTEFPGVDHKIVYGDNLDKIAIANTTKLSRIREDEGSKITPSYSQTTPRDIWRHEGEVTGLIPGVRMPYQVISAVEENATQNNIIKSQIFSLTSLPKPKQALKILLTSDHQLMPMVAANLQKVVETIGQVDAIFFAGDLVNIADRASEWFDDQRGGAFFPCLQGRGNYMLEKEGNTTLYHGGKLIQYAPLFPTIGNHEVMGRFLENTRLNQQFVEAIPYEVANKIYLQKASQINHNNNIQIKQNWIKNNSFNTDTYQEIFSLPKNNGNNQNYYTVTFGDIRLVVLQVTNIWRSPSLEPNVKGRYQESQQDLNNPENWGYGQHIFEPIKKGSSQYQWLEKELNSQEFKQAKYKIVMFHHPVHTLGGNIVPAYTDPLPNINYNQDGNIEAIRYEYPKENDYIIRDLMPLLETAKVNLVFFGHSHLWNRFLSPSGINFLESSNVGNSYGAHLGDNKRPIPPNYSKKNYREIGNPNGLEPIIPNLNPLRDENNNPLPYIASNDITIFSILDTEKGTISSYRFDTRQGNSEVIKFDEFTILRGY
ncbi:metallophosphoesterase family protein [Crocosphaera sp. XPORK-15E]|uniref:metallophosphoesterase family protein n=1 Tax=Crocosphaera sp. XPORK-15E TaxID=3110247 RepID=UPI002B20F558|nr:metallophosphoesterase [Crocosphaera sp. XPORK-15E]MEA5533019.1 metallophosphoesterase [Crocosphaera sp. XPORK-15E]